MSLCNYPTIMKFIVISYDIQSVHIISDYIIIPYPRERGPTMEYPPTPHFGLNFLLRSSVYSNMRPCVAALKTQLKWLVYEDRTS